MNWDILLTVLKCKKQILFVRCVRGLSSEVFLMLAMTILTTVFNHFCVCLYICSERHCMNCTLVLSSVNCKHVPCRGSDRFKRTGISSRSCRAELSKVWSAWPNYLACDQGEHDGLEPAEQLGNHSGPFLYKSPKPHDWWSSLQFAFLRWNGRW